MVWENGIDEKAEEGKWETYRLGRVSRSGKWVLPADGFCGEFVVAMVGKIGKVMVEGKFVELFIENGSEA